MESLNLNTLASSLPGGQQNAEKEILNDFKAAALSITTLYRSSRKNSKRAFNAGYSSACKDLLNFVQQGVSASDVGELPSGSSQHVEGGGMTIGRVMDWIEARVDAIRAREEEEEEDEEREKDKDRTARAPAAAPPAQTAAPPVAPLKSHQPPNKPPKPSTSSLPTPSSPASHTLTSQSTSSAPSSPSPTPSGPSSRAGTRPIMTANKVRLTPTRETFQNSSEPPSPTATAMPYPDAPIVIGAGAKRRHAMMMMLDSSNPTISIGGPSSTVSSPGGVGGINTGNTPSNLGKRRTRGPRNMAQLQPHNPNISVIQMGAEEMDVEEDGRERKRVARR